MKPGTISAIISSDLFDVSLLSPAPLLQELQLSHTHDALLFSFLFFSVLF